MASQNQSYRAGEARGQSETNQILDTTKEKAQAAKEKTYQTAQAAKDKTAQAARDKTAQAARDKTSKTTDATKQKSQETGRVARDRGEVGKEKTGGILNQAGDQVKNVTQGAADALKHNFGFDSTGEDDHHDTATTNRRG